MFGDLGMRGAARGVQARTRPEPDLQLQASALWVRLGQLAKKLEGVCEMAQCLPESRAAQRNLARPLPISGRAVDDTRFGEMAGHHFGPARSQVWQADFHRRGNP